jgi:protein-tyrosine phosphatase
VRARCGWRPTGERPESYLLASGVDIELPDLAEIEEIDTEGGTTNLSDTTTLEDTTVDIPAPEEPAPPVSPDLRQFEELNRCIERAGGDIDRITACFDRLR